MADVQIINGDALVRGTLRITDTLVMPDSTVTNVKISASAAIAATKVEHQHSLTYSQADGSAVAAAIMPIYTCRGATATIVAIEAVCIDAPSGGDLAFTVDLHKADEGTPTPATVLTGTIAYSATQSDCEVEAGSIASPSLVVGDSLLAIVAVSGSTGTQGQGLVVTVTVREDAD